MSATIDGGTEKGTGAFFEHFLNEEIQKKKKNVNIKEKNVNIFNS